MRLNRRQLLLTGGTAFAAGIAGCLDPPSLGDASDPSGSAAFYTLMDWGNQVGGEELVFETPVEVGEMGHGWDPDADIIPEIAQHEIFFHLATPEFQWAIDIANELAMDDHDVHVIDGLQGIPQEEFLPFTGSEPTADRRPDSDVDWEPLSTEISEFELVYGGEVTGWWHDGHWHGGLPDVPEDDTRHISFHVTDTDGHTLPLGPETPFSIRTRLGQGAPADRVNVEDQGDAVVFTGESSGQTTIYFEVLAEGEVIFETSADPLLLTVVDADSVAIDAFYDPHVWVDPIHAQRIVQHLADELTTVFPEHGDEFESNAATYIERIQRVDDAFHTLAEEATIDVAVVVAHDAFQYLEARYGFDFRTPVGVTPDAAESIDDVARLSRTIEEYDIDTILFDPFESPNPDTEIPQAARLLLEETRAEHAEPLTPVEGITPSWRDQGYGWVEQMEEVNLPSLRQALKVDP